jgi:hypothetical protein
MYRDKEEFLRRKPGPTFPAFAAEGWLELSVKREKSGSDTSPPLEHRHCLAVFSGVVNKAEECTNDSSGLDFHHFVVQVRSRAMDVVAEPGLIEGANLERGGVIHGRFFLTARVLPEASKKS